MYNILYVCFIDLDLADGKITQIVEAGLTGSKIIQCNADSHFHQIPAQTGG